MAPSTLGPCFWHGLGGAGHPHLGVRMPTRHLPAEDKALTFRKRCGKQHRCLVPWEDRRLSTSRIILRLIFIAALLHTGFFLLGKVWVEWTGLDNACSDASWCAEHHLNPPEPSERLLWSLRAGTCPLGLYDHLSSAGSSPGLGPAGGIAAQGINSDRVRGSVQYTAFKIFFFLSYSPVLQPSFYMKTLLWLR